MTAVAKTVKGMSLVEMARWVQEVNTANGWFDSQRTFGDDLALLHTEVSEMYEAYRSWGTEDHTGVDDPASKPEGVGSEAADILVRALDTAVRYDFIDINGLGEFLISDFTLDGDNTFGEELMELHRSLAWAWDLERGYDLPEGFAFTRQDCINMLLVDLRSICDFYDIDLLWEFERKMNYNATRPYRHGNKLV